MTTEQAVKIGDIIIDEETGEILEMPQGIGDPLEWLTHRANEANAASNAWKDIAGWYKKALGELLTKAGMRSLRTKYGAPGWRSRQNRNVRIDKLPEVIEEYELTHGHILGLLLCASGLNVKMVDALGLPDGAKKELIDEQPPTTYVQISPATPQPPDVESVKRP